MDECMNEQPACNELCTSNCEDAGYLSHLIVRALNIIGKIRHKDKRKSYNIRLTYN
jgi:hypothetical protein